MRYTTRPLSDRITVERLIEQLREVPGHLDVVIETIVGGDIGLDDVYLEEVEVRGVQPSLCLIPDRSDSFDTRTLIDEGLEARAVAEQAEADRQATVLCVSSEEALFAFLDALNVSGLHPELACTIQGASAPFLAGLTDPDADHVHFTVTDSDSGVVHCCECSHPGERADRWDANSWRPTYPISALVTEWPDMARVDAEDHIDAWWADR